MTGPQSPDDIGRMETQLLALGRATFPEATAVNINMMPFVIGDHKSLPPEHAQYWPLIESCGVEQDENGKVGYLTVMESYVPQGTTQRRPGIHTDGHCCRKGKTLGWGGWGSGRRVGDGTLHVKGIYVASTVLDTCRAWDIEIDNSGWMGDCEQCPDLMEMLANKPFVMMESNRIYWMTDRCPHESLPMKDGGMRQFFRLVTSAVDVWYSRHSTPNRLGIKAPCMHVGEDKFAIVPGG